MITCLIHTTDVSPHTALNHYVMETSTYTRIYLRQKYEINTTYLPDFLQDEQKRVKASPLGTYIQK